MDLGIDKNQIHHEPDSGPSRETNTCFPPPPQPIVHPYSKQTKISPLALLFIECQNCVLFFVSNSKIRMITKMMTNLIQRIWNDQREVNRHKSIIPYAPTQKLQNRSKQRVFPCFPINPPFGRLDTKTLIVNTILLMPVMVAIGTFVAY